MRAEDAASRVREARSWLALALVEGLSPRDALALARGLGGPAAVLDTPEPRLVAAGLRQRVAARVCEARDRLAGEEAALARVGAQAVAWGAPEYPARLAEIPTPPLALAVRGTLAADEPAVAVVGARRASEYGRRLAREIAHGLGLAGVTVVSGLAAGVDAAAHEGALGAGGRTIAVLGTGIDVVYPPWHRTLASRVAGQGALVSEFPCGTPPRPHHFPRRNRVLSGLAVATVVVEAAEDSGSLITAEHALAQGRDVLAVPGPVGPRHAGPHRLVREGAKLVTCADDVLAEVAPACLPRLASARRATATATLTDTERALLATLGPEGRQVDDVVSRLSLPVGPALEALLALELRGLVDQLPGMRFRRAA